MNHPESTSPSGVFELSGGELCLDFANSWGNRNDASTDRLTSYERLLRFGVEAGHVGAEAFDRALARAEFEPEAAQDALTQAVELRELLFALFDAKARCLELPGPALETLNEWIERALPCRRLQLAEEGLEWCWRTPRDDDWLAVVYPCVHSAARLLTSEELGRVRLCDADDCTWLFLDRSRSRSRRWCSMESCGNRAKARRHYRRHHGD